VRRNKFKLQVSTKQKTLYRKIILSISMAAIAGACLIVFNNLGTSENAKADAVSQAEVAGGGVDDETIINLPTSSISITGDSISSSVAKFLSNRVINCAREINGSLPTTFIPYRSENSPLSVVLKSFIVKETNEKALLLWETASELNNDYFLLERSWDGMQYEQLGRIKGAGTTPESSKYSFTDDEPFSGTSYYRLTQVDFNSEQEVFAPITFILELNLNEFKLIQLGPNPFKQELSLLMQFPTETQLKSELFTLSGGRVWETVQKVSAGRMAFTLRPEVSAAGVFYLRLTTLDGKRVFTKLVKQ
jgi:hypothetical protein